MLATVSGWLKGFWEMLCWFVSPAYRRRYEEYIQAVLPLIAHFNAVSGRINFIHDEIEGLYIKQSKLLFGYKTTKDSSLEEELESNDKEMHRLVEECNTYIKRLNQLSIEIDSLKP